MFLSMGPAQFHSLPQPQDQSSAMHANGQIRRYQLANGDSIGCALWKNLFFITGTDIVKILVFRFEAIGRPVSNMKKFEEGVFSDLRNLKPDQDASLEEPRSPFLEFLFDNGCIRTQKKQKVFYWYSVPHDRIFLDALERDLKRESMGLDTATTVSPLFQQQLQQSGLLASSFIQQIPQKPHQLRLPNLAMKPMTGSYLNSPVSAAKMILQHHHFPSGAGMSPMSGSSPSLMMVPSLNNSASSMISQHTSPVPPKVDAGHMIMSSPQSPPQIHLNGSPMYKRQRRRSSFLTSDNPLSLHHHPSKRHMVEENDHNNHSGMQSAGQQLELTEDALAMMFLKSPVTPDADSFLHPTQQSNIKQDQPGARYKPSVSPMTKRQRSNSICISPMDAKMSNIHTPVFSKYAVHTSPLKGSLNMDLSQSGHEIFDLSAFVNSDDDTHNSGDGIDNASSQRKEEVVDYGAFLSICGDSFDDLLDQGLF